MYHTGWRSSGGAVTLESRKLWRTFTCLLKNYLKINQPEAHILKTASKGRKWSLTSLTLKGSNQWKDNLLILEAIGDQPQHYDHCEQETVFYVSKAGLLWDPGWGGTFQTVQFLQTSTVSVHCKWWSSEGFLSYGETSWFGPFRLIQSELQKQTIHSFTNLFQKLVW